MLRGRSLRLFLGGGGGSSGNEVFKSIDDMAMRGAKSKRLLLAINKNVYDATEFVKRHPGGPILANYKGKDATDAFKAQGHKPLAFRELEKLKVGHISG